MKEINGKIDRLDYEYFHKRFGEPIAALPAPFVEGEFKFNTTRFLMKDGQLGFVSHVKPIYYYHHNGTCRPLEEVLEHHGNDLMILKPDWDTRMHPAYFDFLIRRQDFLKGKLLIPSPYGTKSIKPENVLFTSFGPLFPLAGTAQDGYAGNNPAQTAWATLRTGSGNESGTASPVAVPRLASGSTSNNWAEITRMIIPIDTSSIGSGATVNTATVSVFGAGDTLDSFSQTIVCTASSQASNTAIANSDYQLNTGETLYVSSGITVASWSTTGYNDSILTSTGLSNVNVTGLSHFGLQFSGDQSNTTPTWSASTASSVTSLFSDQSGTSHDPKIAGTYTPPATTKGNFLVFM